MSLTPEQVRHVASLARLSLSPDEVQRAQVELSAVLGAIEVISALDTSSVEPTTAMRDAAAPLRTDVVQPTLGTQVALANAPAREGTSFAVPKVIE